MNLPYVIDNQNHRLSDILNGLLAEHKGRSLDVATAYFTVGGFGLNRSRVRPFNQDLLGLKACPGLTEKLLVG